MSSALLKPCECGCGRIVKLGTGRTKEQEEKRRKHYFGEYGFRVLIIWENELRHKNKVREKIVQFAGEVA